MQNATSCFATVEPRVAFSTINLLPSTLIKSNVIYEFVCHCDSRYVGRTSQRLLDRIKQHIPKSIRNPEATQISLPPRLCKMTTTILDLDSAIGLHLLQNKECAQNYNHETFSVLAKGRSSFHLCTLEATFIKTRKPILCRKKEFVYSLKVIH